ncbi:hypothetical protein F441_22236 [Phytophthora nicotianae CJ01A1]|uniref:Uncharacterized protein n=1 Tax=Phytophthora nicotianae CJ01A1 TaxID=1317063 RepID=W2VSK3_PHYNI|nr:hypothetical protein F441_22236 [Phytophthora nicotianae CJ01A1]
MHPFCGKPVGQEGFGQHVVCPDCDSGKPQAISAPPILKAFALEGNKGGISSKDAANDVDSDESSEDDIISISTLVNVTELPTSTSSRASQQVTTIQNRRRVISWMEEYEKVKGKKRVNSKALSGRGRPRSWKRVNASFNLRTQTPVSHQLDRQMVLVVICQA